MYEHPLPYHYNNRTLSSFIKNKKGILFYYFEGLGGTLNTLGICSWICDKYNIPLVIYPNYRANIPDNKLYLTNSFSMFFDYFFPKIGNIINNPENYQKYVSTNETQFIFNKDTLDLALQYVLVKNKIHDFDKEYQSLNESFNLQNRIGVHFRFFYPLSLYLKENIRLIQLINRINKPLFVATDNIDEFNKIKKMIKVKDIFILPDITRANKINNNIEYLNFSNSDFQLGRNIETNKKAFYTQRVNDLKEAYFISKCKEFYGNSGSLYSFLINYLRRT